MKTALRLEAFEDRLVPAVAVDTGYEAYAWNLINTLRANPASFADKLQGLIDSTGGPAFGFTASDPVLTDLRNLKARGNQTNYADALALMRRTAGLGPLAWDEILEGRAGVHNDWMKINGFSHTGTTGGPAIPGFTNNPGAAPDVYGYPANRYSAWGENIGYQVGSLRESKAALTAGSITLAGLYQRSAFIDTVGYVLEIFSASLGHLENLLQSDAGSGLKFNAIGLDIDLFEAGDQFEAMDGVPEASVSTHRPALYRPNSSGGFATGLVYSDANANGFYDVSEEAAATVEVRDGSGTLIDSVALTTANRGAFAFYLDNGTYDVNIVAGGSVVDTRRVAIANNNQWAGFNLLGVGKANVTAPTGVQGTLRPTVTWDSVLNAVSYDVRIDDRTTLRNNILPGTNTTVTSLTLPSDLVSGRSYRVYVRAVGPAGPGAWSDPVAFSIGKPTVLQPTGTVADLRPTVGWSKISGATYQVRVDDVSTARTNIFPGTSTNNDTWSPTADLVSGRTYRVMVRAVNGAGLGAWGPAVTFAVGKPAVTAPAAPAADLRPSVSWTAVAGATAYEVRVRDLTTLAILFPGTRVSATSWTPPDDLISGRKYTVAVRAVNAANLGAWSTAATFTVALPTPSGPTGDVAGVRPTFQWSEIAGAASYDVILTDLTTGKRVALANSTTTSWDPSADLIVGHRYRWRVRALNNDAVGTWSLTMDFRVV